MRILFATDGSESSLAGARVLRTMTPSEIELCVLTVAGRVGDNQEEAAWLPPIGAHETGKHEDNEGHAALSATFAELGDGWRTLRSETRRGNPAEEVLRAAEEAPFDMIVVGSRGLGAVARFLLGSVAERVARHARCPVLVARPGEGTFQKVLLGVDGSTCSEDAANWLLRLPLPAESTVRLVTVIPPMDDIVRASRMVPLPLAEDPVGLDQRLRDEAQQRLESLAAPFEQTGRKVDAEVRGGHGALGLLEAAEEWGADLIVVGAHGLSAIDRFLLGSVSEHVLRHAPCSVLVVKQ